MIPLMNQTRDLTLQGLSTARGTRIYWDLSCLASVSQLLQNTITGLLFNDAENIVTLSDNARHFRRSNGQLLCKTLRYNELNILTDLVLKRYVPANLDSSSETPRH